MALIDLKKNKQASMSKFRLRGPQVWAWFIKGLGVLGFSG